MSPGPIPFTAIVEYFRLYEIGGEWEEFIYLVRRMDNAYLSLEAKKVKEKQAENKPAEKKPEGKKHGGHASKANKNQR